MAVPPRTAPLNEADLLIPDGALKGDQLKLVFRRLYAQLNPFFDSVMALGGSVSLAQNDRADLITGSFTHGVATPLRLKRIRSAKSAIIRSCSGAAPSGVPSVQMQTQPYPGAPATALVTIFFSNPAAAGVTALVELREEGLGQAASAPPRDGVRAFYVNAAAQSFVSATDTVVNFDSLIADTDAAVRSGSQWAFTVPPGKTGLYECSAGVTLITPSGATAVPNLRLKLRVNGVVQAVLGNTSVPAVSSLQTEVSGSMPVSVNAGDRIDFVLMQNCGSTLSAATPAQLSRGTWCSIVRLLGY